MVTLPADVRTKRPAARSHGKIAPQSVTTQRERPLRIRPLSRGLSAANAVRDRTGVLFTGHG